MFNAVEYLQYKLMVQKDLTGADIHKINTYLGNMVNSISIVGYAIKKNDTDLIDKYTKLFDDSKKKVDEYMIEKAKKVIHSRK